MLKALVENLRKIFRLPSVKSVAFSVTHALVHFVQTEKQTLQGQEKWRNHK